MEYRMQLKIRICISLNLDGRLLVQGEQLLNVAIPAVF